ncbi:hypothetical protein NP493_1060g01040 [Ridgeia piscesae]|uniref:Uncharacterized protein n=1 Tax=Ridgeia piscesae TaxID=27915 RepID=A0AAD9KH56_RIDPI|nr:hypothetical protein NP493_1060g01040 [Ridgeia piscesae]
MLRTSAEERRKKSPSFLSLRSQVSILSDAQLDEDGDMPFPPDTAGEAGRSVSFHDAATSPMTTMPDLHSAGQSRASFGLASHPVVQEFLGMYSEVVDFKDQISEMFANKEMMSPAQVLADIEPVEFNEDDRVQPQVEVMHQNTTRSTPQTLALIYAALANERDYPVSSLAGNSKLMSVSTMETMERVDAAASPSTQLTKQPSQSSTGPGAPAAAPAGEAAPGAA